jgi:hypothetical protein
MATLDTTRSSGGGAGPVQPSEHMEGPVPPDAAARRLQVLSTEHWSLLTTRSLIYSESFNRVTLFLSLLTGAVVALALLAQADHFHETFDMAAILILSVVLFVGLATFGRLSTLNMEDLRTVMGMNRLRHAYVRMDPEVEQYLLAGCHDDLRGVMLTMHMQMVPGRRRPTDVAHGFQTLPAMVGVIVAVVAGVLGALLAGRLGASMLIAVVGAAAVFLATVVLLGLSILREFDAFARKMPSRFPSDTVGET